MHKWSPDTFDSLFQRQPKTVSWKLQNSTKGPTLYHCLKTSLLSSWWRVCVCVCVCACVRACVRACTHAQLCLTLWNPMNCIAHQVPLSIEFSMTRILECVAVSFSLGSSWPCTGRQILYHWATWKSFWWSERTIYRIQKWFRLKGDVLW